MSVSCDGLSAISGLTVARVSDCTTAPPSAGPGTHHARNSLGRKLLFVGSMLIGHWHTRLLYTLKGSYFTTMSVINCIKQFQRKGKGNQRPIPTEARFLHLITNVIIVHRNAQSWYPFSVVLLPTKLNVAKTTEPIDFIQHLSQRSRSIHLGNDFSYLYIGLYILLLKYTYYCRLFFIVNLLSKV